MHFEKYFFATTLVVSTVTLSLLFVSDSCAANNHGKREDIRELDSSSGSWCGALLPSSDSSDDEDDDYQFNLKQKGKRREKVRSSAFERKEKDALKKEKAARENAENLARKIKEAEEAKLAKTLSMHQQLHHKDDKKKQGGKK